MATVEVSAGPIEYTDTGGDGRVLVLLHGLAMDGRLWDGVVATLGDEWRFVMPTLPFGAHRVPMHPDADLSLRGVGRIVAELLERLDLRDVMFCFNDWGGVWSPVREAGPTAAGRPGVGVRPVRGSPAPLSVCARRTRL
jgi:pimeloyl-ACP methyl ester carboxylesterase